MALSSKEAEISVFLMSFPAHNRPGAGFLFLRYVRVIILLGKLSTAHFSSFLFPSLYHPPTLPHILSLASILLPLRFIFLLPCSFSLHFFSFRTLHFQWPLSLLCTCPLLALPFPSLIPFLLSSRLCLSLLTSSSLS